MPRMRTLKPEAASSESLCGVVPAVRWTFAMLWTYLDDDGRGVRNPRLVKAAVYPLDDDMTPGVVEDHLADLERVGCLCYYSIDGKNYVHVPAWSEHQHPNRKVDSRLPPCPKLDHSEPTHAQRTEPAVSSPPQSSPVVVVVVGDGDGEVDGEGDGGVEAQAPTTAHTIIAEWMEHSPKRPPGQVISVIGKHVRAMLGEGIDPDDVRRGLAAWMDKGLHESTLPSVVNEVMNGGGRRATRKRDTDDKVRDGLALAQRLLAGEQEPGQHHNPRQIGA